MSWLGFLPNHSSISFSRPSGKDNTYLRLFIFFILIFDLSHDT